MLEKVKKLFSRERLQYKEDTREKLRFGEDRAVVYNDPSLPGQWAHPSEVTPEEKNIAVDGNFSVTHGICDYGGEGSKYKTKNEDSMAVGVAEDGADWVIVVDGAGGSGNGLRASQIGTQTIRDILSRGKSHQDEDRMRTALDSAHDAIKQYNIDNVTDGYCCAAGARIEVGDTGALTAEVAWVGDATVLIIRDGKVLFGSKPHNHVANLVDGGHIPAEAYYNHPQKNFVTNTIGSSEDDSYSGPGLERIAVQEGDLIICGSDGALRDCVSDYEVAQLAKKFKTDPRGLQEAIFSLAYDRQNRGDTLYTPGQTFDEFRAAADASGLEFKDSDGNLIPDGDLRYRILYRRYHTATELASSTTSTLQHDAATKVDLTAMQYGRNDNITVTVTQVREKKSDRSPVDASGKKGIVESGIDTMNSLAQRAVEKMEEYKKKRTERLQRVGLSIEDLPEEFRVQLSGLDADLQTKAQRMQELRAAILDGKTIADVEGAKTEYETLRTEFVKGRVDLWLAEELAFESDKVQRVVESRIPMVETARKCWQKLGEWNLYNLVGERVSDPNDPDYTVPGYTEKAFVLGAKLFSVRTAIGLGLASTGAVLGASVAFNPALAGAGILVARRAYGMAGAYFGFDTLATEKSLRTAESKLAVDAWPRDASGDIDIDGISKQLLEYQVRARLEGRNPLQSDAYVNALQKFNTLTERMIQGDASPETKLAGIINILDQKLGETEIEMKKKRRVRKLLTALAATAVGSGALFQVIGKGLGLAGEGVSALREWWASSPDTAGTVDTQHVAPTLPEEPAAQPEPDQRPIEQINAPLPPEEPAAQPEPDQRPIERIEQPASPEAQQVVPDRVLSSIEDSDPQFKELLDAARDGKTIDIASGAWKGGTITLNDGGQLVLTDKGGSSFIIDETTAKTVHDNLGEAAIKGTAATADGAPAAPIMNPGGPDSGVRMPGIGDYTPDQWETMTVGKGEGFWHAMQRQIAADPAKFGYDGTGNKSAWITKKILSIMHETKLNVDGKSVAIIDAKAGTQLWVMDPNRYTMILGGTADNTTLTIVDNTTHQVVGGDSDAMSRAFDIKGFTPGSASGESVATNITADPSRLAELMAENTWYVPGNPQESIQNWVERYSTVAVDDAPRDVAAWFDGRLDIAEALGQYYDLEEQARAAGTVTEVGARATVGGGSSVGEVANNGGPGTVAPPDSLLDGMERGVVTDVLDGTKNYIPFIGSLRDELVKAGDTAVPINQNGIEFSADGREMMVRLSGTSDVRVPLSKAVYAQLAEHINRSTSTEAITRAEFASVLREANAPAVATTSATE